MKIIIHNNDSFKMHIKSIDEVIKQLTKDGKTCVLELKEYNDKRTLSSNALYWLWMSQMASYFSKNHTRFTKDNMHDLMRHKFLGYEDKVIGDTHIKGQLVSSSSLTTTKMYFYMSQIDAWAADHGCLLFHPSDGEYMKYKECV